MTSCTPNRHWNDQSHTETTLYDKSHTETTLERPVAHRNDAETTSRTPNRHWSDMSHTEPTNCRRRPTDYLPTQHQHLADTVPTSFRHSTNTMYRGANTAPTSYTRCTDMKLTPRYDKLCLKQFVVCLYYRIVVF